MIRYTRSIGNKRAIISIACLLTVACPALPVEPKQGRPRISTSGDVGIRVATVEHERTNIRPQPGQALVPNVADFGMADGFEFAGLLPTDCNNDGCVNLLDYNSFEFCLSRPAGGGPVECDCDCFDVNHDGVLDLLDFGVLQSVFGGPACPELPPPPNIFVLQLLDYHGRCSVLDGGDMTCHEGDLCCQLQRGPPGTPCPSLEGFWEQLCDGNSDGERDRQATLTTLAEWNDFSWDPGDGTNALAAEHYPNEFQDRPYTRYFVPMCEDGTTPAKGTTVCPDGKPVIQCTDGTRPVFYYHQGTTDRWIIHVQNGGVTCSNRQDPGPDDCWVDADRLAFSTAWAHNPDTKRWQGLMDADNSPFASYNLVVIDKCVGDRNLGDNTVLAARGETAVR